MQAEYLQARKREEREQDLEQRRRYERQLERPPGTVIEVFGWRAPRPADSRRQYARIFEFQPNPLVLGRYLLRCFGPGYRGHTNTSDQMHRADGDGDELEAVTHCRLLLGSGSNGRTGIAYSNAGFPFEYG